MICQRAASIILLYQVIVFTGLIQGASYAAENSRPNIVLIMADDMGYSDIGCYGGEITTPNLDRLAADGIRFSQFYNTARCCPTRASLMTGLHPHQTGIGHMTNTPNGLETHDKGVYGYRGFLNRDCITIAEALKTAGYHTYMSGKWHMGYHSRDRWPLQRGFDRYYGIISGASSYFDPRPPRGLTLDNEHVDPEGDDYYTTDAFTDYAIRYIRDQRDEDPFFLYLAYTAPHWPLHAKEQDIRKFAGSYMKGWDVLRSERRQRQIEMGLLREEWQLSPEDARPWEHLSESQKEELAYRMAVYAAQIYSIDENIGRLVRALKEEGKWENTLVLFLADNGGCAEGGELGGGQFSDINNAAKATMISYGRAWANASNTPFRRYKHFVHEGGIATPLIAHWPDVIKDRQGAITHAPGYLIDIMPTLLEISGAQYPEKFNGHTLHPLEGKSLLPVFQTGDRDGHEWMFWEHENNCAVRWGKWKAIQRYGTDHWELYDLDADRTETRNLAAERPELVTQLTGKWHDWARSHHVVPKSKKE